MKRLFKWLAWVVIVIVVAIVALVGYVYAATSSRMGKTYHVTGPKLAIPSDPASIARGKYLAEHISMCVECHGEDLGGKVIDNNFMMGTLPSANLTKGRGGIGSRYTDEDFVRALMHGVRPDGHTVIFMPSSEFHFTESALASLIAYVKSVPPVDREMARPAPGPMARALGLFTDYPLTPASTIDHDRVAFATPKDQNDPVAAGEELVALAGCRGCHGAEFTGGGGPPPGASNITPVGLGDWTEQDFLRAVREHKRPNGSTIDEGMPRLYGGMATSDLQKVFAYLKTLPAKGEKTKNQR